MDAQTKARLTNLETWKRGLFMLVFALISTVAKLLVSLVAVFQFFTVLFKGQTNPAVIPFGQNLSTYTYQITLFLTFATDDMPFPFMDFPDGSPASTTDMQSKDYIATAETKTARQDDSVDLADET